MITLDKTRNNSDRPATLDRSKSLIAWGTSKLLQLYIKQSSANPFSYCIDSYAKRDSYAGIPVKPITELDKEKPGSFQIVIFAVASKSIYAITGLLFERGLRYGKDFILYSDLFYDDFVPKAEALLKRRLDPALYHYAVSFTLNSRTPVHTTILGTWIFLEIIKQTRNLPGAIAEVGSYQGGNALSSLLLMAATGDNRSVYLFDSFEGFPELTPNDPRTFGKGDYNIETSFQEVVSKFVPFPNAHVIKGFVPSTFAEIPTNETFSVAFYDCDLYQPALDTYAFFWDKLPSGGFLVIHDYVTEEGGFTGVKKATDEFFADKKGWEMSVFFENTMAIVRKS